MILQYHPRVRNELENVVQYYASITGRLAQDFVEKYRDAVAQILANPLRFEQVRPGIRRYLMDRFPYGIYYRMPDAKTVRIIIVRHHSRRPGFGMGRQ